MSSQLASFLMLPLYASSLSIEDFAIISMIEVYIFIFIAISSVSISRAAQRFFFDKKIEGKAFDIALSIIFIWGSFVSILLLSIYFILNINLYQLGVQGVFIICLIGLGQNISTLAQVYFQVHQKPLQYLLFVLLKIIILISSVYVLMVWKDFGVSGYLYSQLITYGLLTLYVLNKMRINAILTSISNLKGRELSKVFIIFSLPYVLTVFSQWIMSMSGRLILESYSVPEDVALFALGYKLSTAVFLASSAISMTIVPIIFKNLSYENSLSEGTSSIIKAANFLIVITGITLIIFGKDLFIPFFDEAYQGAFDIISLLIVAHYISGFMGLTSNNFLSFYKKTTIQMICFVISAGVYLSAALILTPFLQIYGVVLSSIISMSVLIILHSIVIKKFNLPCCNYKDFFYGLIIIMVAGAGSYLLPGSIWHGKLDDFIMKVILIIILGICSYSFLRVGDSIKKIKLANEIN
jgi:O-antigen/teichoic acid export membrane protein